MTVSAASERAVQPAEEVLVGQLLAMAAVVEESVSTVLEALLTNDTDAAGAIFINEPRINAMEVFLDEKAVLLLRSARLSEPEVRLTVATIKINNDLERIGDLAVNIAERLLALSGLRQTGIPRDVAAMMKPVQDMLTSSITAIRERDLEAAAHVLETDAVVDRYRDQLFLSLTETMSSDPQHVPVDIHFVLISRHLERIADHATNIAEDVIYWLRGVDVRHGQGLETSQWPHP